MRRLETTGIVSRTLHSSDSRQQPLALTTAGRAEVTTLEAIATTRYAALVRTLPPHTHQPLLDAMERIETAFGVDVPARDASPWLLRPHRAGDVSGVTQRAIASAIEEFELNGAYETRQLRLAADFLDQFDATRDCSWMAERDSVVIGSVLVQRGTGDIARLTMLHVESRARGIGIGRRLIAEAIEFAVRARYVAVDVELLDCMKTARFLSHAAGFRHVSETIDDAFGRRLGRQVWRLELGERAARG
jgi:ribosomal protein S18 acetylase RimI-like enzyme